MKTLKQKLKDILAQVGKVRVDVVLARVAVVTGAVAAIAPWTGLIPGKTGAAVAGICAVAAGLTPRIQHAAGLLSPVYAGQTPLLKVLPELVQTLLAAPQIVAQEKADARAAEEAQKAAQVKAQADRDTLKAAEDKAALVGEVVQQVAEILRTGSFAKGTLSADIPPSLRAAFAAGAVASDPPETADAQETANSPEITDPSEQSTVPVLRSVVTVSDKA